MKNRKTELIVALDYSALTEAESLILKLRGLDIVYKIGLELFVNAGPDFVRKCVKEGHRIFLDLKFHDIPNTVAKASLQAAKLGVEMMTVHLSGGRKMLDTVMAELRSSGPQRPKVLGVSVLTSFALMEWHQIVSKMSERPFPEESGIEKTVQNLAKLAIDAGLDGLVCSPHEVSWVSQNLPELMTVVPGVRPQGAQASDQARTLTPSEAHRAGAWAIVVGRPITMAPDPKEAVKKILSELL